MDNFRFNKNKALVEKYLPLAKEALSQEYRKDITTREKLTHAWLAEELGISRGLAYPLLVKIAQVKHKCVKYPSGPIYWDDYIPTAEELEKLNIPKQIIPDTMVLLMATKGIEEALKKHKLTVMGQYGYDSVRDNRNRIIAFGEVLRVSGKLRHFQNLLKDKKSIWVKEQLLKGEWVEKTTF